jgi:hypothetical protein
MNVISGGWDGETLIQQGGKGKQIVREDTTSLFTIWCSSARFAKDVRRVNRCGVIATTSLLFRYRKIGVSRKIGVEKSVSVHFFDIEKSVSVHFFDMENMN